jgi:D-ornithine 4,5-aminomutase subunit alpha
VSRPRHDDYETRRAALVGLDDAALHALFWDLARRVVEPLLELARTHTTPSIERSVLARLGVPSPEAAAVVEGCLARGILGHGAGHVLLRTARAANLTPVEAAARLAAGELWEHAERTFADAAS